MEPTPKHSPLPWKVAEQVVTDSATIVVQGSGVVTHVARLHGNWISPEHGGTVEENAALIVRAVNSHEAMVQALIKCRELLDNSDVRDYVGRKLGEQSALHAALNESRAALKLAEGE